jgi:AcrR family transcriptional regulator
MDEGLQLSSEARERVDPRIRRTRQMLFESIKSLLQTKSIEEITVADIASQADLNRGTFYDHYPDKFALLEGLVEANFQQLLSQRNIQFDGTCVYALIGITLATCDYLSTVPQPGCPNRRATEKHLEAAISSVVRRMILEGLKKHPANCKLRPELMAASMAGAIFGAAREWANCSHQERAEEVADAVLSLFRPVLESVPAAHR